MRILRKEHMDMAILLDVMDRQIVQFQRGATPDFNIVRGIVSYFLAYPDLYHHPKEDLIIQKLRARAPEKAATMERLLTEHQDLALLTRRFATAVVDQMVHPVEVPNEWFSSLARTFVDTNRRHMAMEDERFFPMLLQVLTEEDWADLGAQVMGGSDPLFGGKVEEHFRALHVTILDLERADAAKQPA
jgi:hemerythrin-like domain-containing protein